MTEKNSNSRSFFFFDNESASIAHERHFSLAEKMAVLDEIRDDYMVSQSQYNAFCAIANDEEKTEKERSEAKMQASLMKEKLERLEDNQAIIEKEIALLQKDIEQKPKNYDKTRTFLNIRELLKEKDIRLGHLEKEAGTQPGYMSRLEKEGNTSDPSLEFVVTAAKVLDVNIDTLINGSFEGLSPTEKLLLQFFQNLISDTRDDVISWHSFSPEFLSSGYTIHSDGRMTYHPLYRRREDSETGEVFPEYVSKYYPFSIIIPGGDCYAAELPTTSAEIYIMNCNREKEDGEKENYYEVYIVDNGVESVCCSKLVCKEIAAIIKLLCDEIEIAANHTHLNKKTEQIINRYLDTRDY